MEVEAVGIQVREVMTADAECAAPRATARNAAEMMRGLGVGFLPVCRGGALLGVLTDRDIVVRVIAAGLDPGKTRVEDCMSSAVATCREEQTIDEACEIMERERVRRLPVVNAEGRIVGILSLDDLAAREECREAALEVLSSIAEPVLR